MLSEYKNHNFRHRKAEQMSAYTIDEVRDRLLPVDEVRETLATTEPLDTHTLTLGELAPHFRLMPGWNYELDTTDGLASVDAYLTLSGKEYQLTKDAILEASSAVGLPKAYTTRTPSGLIEPQLNWWYEVKDRLT